MKKYVNDKFQETYFLETLDNGLKVIINYKPDFKSSSFVFASKYGALDVKQEVNGKIVENNAGIAHFLEHKMFEQKDGHDVMSEFSAMGCSVNAFTSYSETCYYFSTTMNDVSKPLNLLLDFVQELNISEKSVEKEKGIIIQELASYHQMPDSRILNETYKSLYHNIALKYDIGGDKDSVNATSVEELRECYQRNYHPSNMLLVITTFIEPELILSIVKENQSLKVFDSKLEVKRLNLDEPFNVLRKSIKVKMDVSSNKVVLAFKFLDFKFSPLMRSNFEWALRFILELHFTSMNEEYDLWLKEGKINEFFGFDVDIAEGHANMLFYDDDIDSEIFVDFIKVQLEQIKNKQFNPEDFKQLLSRYYGKSFGIFNSVEDMSISFARQYFMGLSFYDMISALFEMDFEMLKESFDSLNFDHYSVIEIEK